MSIGGHSLHKQDYLKLGLATAAVTSPWTIPAIGTALGIGAPAAASDAALMAMDPTGAAAFEGASNPSGGAGLLSRIASNKATPQILGQLQKFTGGPATGMPPPIPPMHPMGAMGMGQGGAQTMPYQPTPIPQGSPISSLDPKLLSMLTPDQLRQYFASQGGMYG